MDQKTKMLILEQCVQENDCESLIREYFALIAKTVSKILTIKVGNPTAADAEEIAQEVIFHLLDNERKRLRAYDPEKGTSLEGWLILITNRLTINYLRKRDPLAISRRRYLNFIDVPESHLKVRHKSRAEDRTLITQVMEAVEQLPPQEKLVFKLHYLDGLDFKAIAGYLNKEVGTVHVCKSRAIKRLKNKLGLEASDF